MMEFWRILAFKEWLGSLGVRKEDWKEIFKEEGGKLGEYGVIEIRKKTFLK